MAAASVGIFGHVELQLWTESSNAHTNNVLFDKGTRTYFYSSLQDQEL